MDIRLIWVCFIKIAGERRDESRNSRMIMMSAEINNIESADMEITDKLLLVRELNTLKTIPPSNPIKKLTRSVFFLLYNALSR